MSRIGLLVTLTASARGHVEDVVLPLLQRLDPGEFRLALAAPATLLDRVAGDERAVDIIRSGREPLRELIGAIHSKLLLAELERRRPPHGHRP